MKRQSDQYYMDFGAPKAVRVVDPTDHGQLPGQTTFDLIDTSTTLALLPDGTIATI